MNEGRSDAPRDFVPNSSEDPAERGGGHAKVCLSLLEAGRVQQAEAACVDAIEAFLGPGTPRDRGQWACVFRAAGLRLLDSPRAPDRTLWVQRVRGILGKALEIGHRATVLAGTAEQIETPAAVFCAWAKKAGYVGKPRS